MMLAKVVVQVAVVYVRVSGNGRDSSGVRG